MTSERGVEVPVATRLPAALERLHRAAHTEGLVDIAYASMDSPVGRLTVAATPVGLLRVGFSGEESWVLQDLAIRVSPRILHAPSRLDPIRRELDAYFEGTLRHFDVPLDWTLVGPFGRRVLQRTLDIPYGQVASYQQVAREIGAPGAARAVGNALGANPIPVVVPCHRVVRTGGALGGYGGGLERKEWLLALEGAGGITSRAVARSD